MSTQPTITFDNLRPEYATGTAIDDVGAYTFAVASDGSFVNLHRDGRTVRRDHKRALHAAVLDAYQHATRGRNLGEQHDAHMRNRATAAALELVTFNPSPYGACATATAPHVVTFADLGTLDLPALWATIPPARQAAIGAAVLRYAFADLVAEDDGTLATDGERHAARTMRDDLLGNEVGGFTDTVAAALPEFQWWDETALTPVWMLSRGVGEGRVLVKGYRGLRRTHREGERLFIRAGGRDVELEGARTVTGQDDAPVYEFWTLAQVEAERRRNRADRQLAA